MNKAGARAMALLNVAGLALAAGCLAVGDVPLALFCAIIHAASLAVATSRPD